MSGKLPNSLFHKLALGLQFSFSFSPNVIYRAGGFIRDQAFEGFWGYADIFRKNGEPITPMGWELDGIFCCTKQAQIRISLGKSF